MLDDFIARLETLQEVSEFENFLQERIESLGFSTFAYLALRASYSDNTPFLLSNYPLAWISRYTQRQYLDYDPVILRASNSIEPFQWSRLIRHELTNKQEAVLNEGAEFGLCHGASVPIYAPHNGFALLSLVTRDGVRSFEGFWRERSVEIHMMTLYFHAAIERKFLQVGKAETVRLTDREREALLWTSQGKTAWETSEIMQISQETANFHLKNVMRKLGVYSKHHAVVKAILMGLIVPETPDPKPKVFKGNAANLPTLGGSSHTPVSLQWQPKRSKGGCHDRSRNPRYRVSLPS